MSEIKRAILPTYLRHLASMAEAATPAFAGAGPLDEPAAGECATVSVPVDVAALREAADEIMRLRDEKAYLMRVVDMDSDAVTEIEQLRALLRAIMDDTSDGQESMSDDIRDRIERALEPGSPPTRGHKP